MKKIYYIVMLLLATFSFHSCDALDLEPEDNFSAGSYWKNEAQVNNFMIGLHSDLRNALVQNALVYGEFRGATLSTKTTSVGTNTQYSVLVQNMISEDNPYKKNWGDMYSRLLQVNHMIENLQSGCTFLSEKSRGYYEGIAYGLRAYYYFWLYRSYGGVPLELDVKVDKGNIDVNTLYMERASAEATLLQIKRDVQTSLDAFAKTDLANDDFHFWSKDASLMLKADVYLWSAKVTMPDAKEPHIATYSREDLDAAKQALNQLPDDYKLEKDFSLLFKNGGKSRKFNNETVLALYLDKDERVERDFFRTFFYHLNFNNHDMVDAEGKEVGSDPLQLFGEGLLYNEYRESLVNSFDKKDTRRAATFFEYFTKENHQFGCNNLKFYGQNSGGQHYFDPDVILYRYADAVLMKAEIENALGNDPSAYINEIRQRAYGENYTSDLAYKNGTFAENELAILKERDKEFVGEGKRWFDLIRLQDANKQSLVFSADAAYAEGDYLAPVLNQATQSYMVLWPIDVDLMNNDPLLKQTVGYPTKK